VIHETARVPPSLNDRVPAAGINLGRRHAAAGGLSPRRKKAARSQAHQKAFARLTLARASVSYIRPGHRASWPFPSICGPLGGSPADFDKFVGNETEKWAKVIKFANINRNEVAETFRNARSAKCANTSRKLPVIL
jgi:hypothetical protein